ncbi:hypothetical protein [Tritonibacter scottomollicae]|uniref:hypothetical protein n=1 Tax=Tritonibacter scottomollicae TaxID=483013 RepID=UPI003AA9497B
MSWVWVDDKLQEAAGLKRLLEAAGLQIDVSKPSAVRERIKDGDFEADGVLMDIELNTDAAFSEDGSTMAQLIRTEQNRGTVAPLPVVRFARRGPVDEYVGSDTSSDDLFVWSIDKDDVAAEKAEGFGITLLGMQEVFAQVGRNGEFLSLVGLEEESWDSFGHPTFRKTYERTAGNHLKAAYYIRLLLTPGPLVGEDLLAVRLGVARPESSGWDALLEALKEFEYRGVAKAQFRRWWTRGVELWWEEFSSSDEPLSSLTIEERITTLGAKFENLVPLKMSDGSPGSRPWHHCQLSWSEHRELVAVDPEFALPVPRQLPSLDVQLRRPSEGWEDPLVVALGPASRNRSKLDVDNDVMERLKARATARNVA